ncbi:MAG TPA: hypothetical protein PLX14_05870 [Anaerolineales bacterium]|nr:hypothetical protein [Anaerolineales bacterium]
MPTVTQTNGKIEITETMSTGIRVFLFIMGLLPWMAPYELLIKPGWTGFSLMTLVFVGISLGAIAVSFGFIGAAIFGMNQTTTFDLNARTITHRYETAVNALRTKRYSFNDITKSEVREHNWDSGPNTYSLEIYFKDKHKILCGNFSSRAEAESVLHQIR